MGRLLKNKKGQSFGGRLALGVIAIVMVFAAFGQPWFIFQNFRWEGGIGAKMWYIIGKLVFLGIAFLAGYIAVKGSE